MSIQISLHHESEYQYDRAIQLGPQWIRLKPAAHTRTPIESYSLKVDPADHFRHWQQDLFGNHVARLVFPKPTRSLKVVVDLVAEMTVINPFDFFIEENARSWPFDFPESMQHALSPYLRCCELTPRFNQWLDSLPKKSERLIDYLVELNRRCNEEIKYLVRLEPGVQTAEETLELGSGSCRDSAWLLLETLRHLGLPARFVSGYLIQLTADKKSTNGATGPEKDFCDLHAWTEVFVPGAGWLGLDPTSGLLAGEGHLPLACTPSFEDAAPLSGLHEACNVEFSHRMEVQRFQEVPRVTKPYTDSQWKKILELGDRVDESLHDSDVRLTMGGEPTFVSADNVEDPQWNTEAVGLEKRVLSNQLLYRLRDRIAPGALLHFGQGKWYPGESLPRWALSCIWRVDGEPIWKDDAWLADAGKEGAFTNEDAKRFVNFLANRLGVDAEFAFSVYEDPYHFLWRESRLPPDVDLNDSKLEDPNERAMVTRAFDSGLQEPVGFCLPIRCEWWQAKPRWISSRWNMRSERVYLIPGNSPVGLRLPLDSLPYAGRESQATFAEPLDPTAPKPPLNSRNGSPTNCQIHQQVSYQTSKQIPGAFGNTNSAAYSHSSADSLFPSDTETTNGSEVRTALCVECRNGQIHLFLPPVQRLEDFLELVDAIESTCIATQLPVMIEGYLPPPDDRIQLFKITPDPGVIEVNTHPTASWRELVELTETIDQEANACKLRTEKFDLDGRHTGTGGGNHLVLGGSKPLDSPFLRRPDLLGSLIAFWNNHPSLSYLFSGRFIGPTSQAPRLDEGRPQSVEELEIALGQIPCREQSCPPWLVDRLFRDLLIDPTGNTHRSEICIDKLYSPDSATGRLGLVEFRGFEMPPDARMSLVQQLLLRSLVSVFWEQPYTSKLQAWGRALHDRFMLPFFVWSDLREVTEYLIEHGVLIQSEWFRPHFEFRFPLIGEAKFRDVRLTLRSAIEPWYVLGEEPGSGGTSRYVDSSLERLEIMLDGLDPQRYRVLCNGKTLPLTETSKEGNYVAGVRYRAWQPPRCLHPTLAVDSPLNFEVIDTDAGLSIGGCRYYVADPGGLGSERFPVNSNEAEARRAGRFEKQGHTGGHFDKLHLDKPFKIPQRGVTLDLRCFR